MSTPPKQKRFPPRVADDLIRANGESERLSGLRGDALGDLLNRFRDGLTCIEGRSSYKYGLTTGRQAISLELHTALHDLDRAWKKYHEYRAPGGPANYAAEDVLLGLMPEALLRRQQDLGKRQKTVRDGQEKSDHAGIEARLRARDYPNLEWGNAGKVRKRIAEEYQVSERTVSAIAEGAGLQRKRKKVGRKKVSQP